MTFPEYWRIHGEGRLDDLRAHKDTLSPTRGHREE